MRSPWIAAVAVAVGLVAVACTPAPSAAAPSTVVLQAMQLVEQGQFQDLVDLACVERRDDIANDFGLGQAVPDLPPGIDLEAFAPAVSIGTDGLEVTDLAQAGDQATVHVEGTMTATVDRERLAQIIGDLGLPLDDAFVERIIEGIGDQLGQGIPIDEDITLVREDGAWKIC
jgi:hypothetical protein